MITPYNSFDILSLCARHGVCEGMEPLLLWIGLSACVIILALSRKEIAWEGRLAWCYAALSSLVLLSAPTAHFGDLQRAIQGSAGLSFALLLAVPLAVLALKSMSKSIKMLRWIMSIEIILIWTGTSALLIAPTFDLAFLALYLPFAGPWLFTAIVVTILAHRGSTALLVILAMAFAWELQNLRLRYVFASTAGLLALLFPLAYLRANSTLLDGSERLAVWAKQGAWWAQSWELMLPGVGQGSYRWTSLALAGYKVPFFGNAHSDWFQILFELGIVGLFLSLLVFRRAVLNTYCDNKLFPAVFGVAAFMLTYHPLRFFPSLFLVTLILISALTKKEER